MVSLLAERVVMLPPVTTALCLTAVRCVLKLCQTTGDQYAAFTRISVSVSFIKYLFTRVTITP